MSVDRDCRELSADTKKDFIRPHRESENPIDFILNDGRISKNIKHHIVGRPGVLLTANEWTHSSRTMAERDNKINEPTRNMHCLIRTCTQHLICSNGYK